MMIMTMKMLKLHMCREKIMGVAVEIRVFC